MSPHPQTPTVGGAGVRRGGVGGDLFTGQTDLWYCLLLRNIDGPKNSSGSAAATKLFNWNSGTSKEDWAGTGISSSARGLGCLCFSTDAVERTKIR